MVESLLVEICLLIVFLVNRKILYRCYVWSCSYFLTDPEPILGSEPDLLETFFFLLEDCTSGPNLDAICGEMACVKLYFWGLLGVCLENTMFQKPSIPFILTAEIWHPANSSFYDKNIYQTTKKKGDQTTWRFWKAQTPALHSPANPMTV